MSGSLDTDITATLTITSEDQNGGDTCPICGAPLEGGRCPYCD